MSKQNPKICREVLFSLSVFHQHKCCGEINQPIKLIPFALEPIKLVPFALEPIKQVPETKGLSLEQIEALFLRRGQRDNQQSLLAAGY